MISSGIQFMKIYLIHGWMPKLKERRRKMEIPELSDKAKNTIEDAVHHPVASIPDLLQSAYPMNNKKIDFKKLMNKFNKKYKSTLTILDE